MVNVCPECGGSPGVHSKTCRFGPQHLPLGQPKHIAIYDDVWSDEPFRGRRGGGKSLLNRILAEEFLTAGGKCALCDDSGTVTGTDGKIG